MRHVIVDGYNVIHASPAYEALADRDLDAARAALVADVASWAAREFRAWVVFDAASNPGSTGTPHHVHGVAVVFSPAGRDADSVIEELAHRFRDQGGVVVVATSDGAMQDAVMGMGAVRMSARELLMELEGTRSEVAEATASGSRSGRLEDRIDPDTRDALWRWARGI